jgi:hypothetical protein
MKRLLDREMDTQRVKVRCKDAMLTKKMARVVLCNSLPECMDNDAVQDRIMQVKIHDRLFPIERSVKFRGTHLLDTEEAYDQDDDTDVVPLAWSYGGQRTRAEKQQQEFENSLKNSAYEDITDVVSESKLEEMSAAALL